MVNMEYKKICVVTPGLLPIPAIRGGAIEQLVDLLIENNEKNHLFELTVIGKYDSRLDKIYKTKKHTIFINYHESEKGNKIFRIFRCFVYNATKKIKKPFWRIIPYYFFVSKVLGKNAEKYDYIVNEGFQEFAVYSNIVRRYGKKKLILHLHANTLSNHLIEETFGGALAISQFVERHFIGSQSVEIPTQTVFNAIDIDRFVSVKLRKDEIDNLRIQYGFKSDDFVLLYCGRIVKEKGVRELVNAVVKQTDKSVKLLIVGSSAFEGAFVTDYEKIVRKLVAENEKIVTIAGYIDNRELYKYHQISDIAVFPALCEEGFCVSLAETMASGLPSIVSRSGGMVEVASEETSLFINKSNIENEISKAILKLRNDKTKLAKMSKACVERARFFDGCRYAYRYLDALLELGKSKQ